MGSECVLSCSLNFESTNETMGKGYVCSPKQCEDRMAWPNGSCSMEIDFPVEGEGEKMECYLWRVEDGIENCVVKGNCPSGYSEVCFLYFNFNFYINISVMCCLCNCLY
jgi:hypothetical protein